MRHIEKKGDYKMSKEQLLANTIEMAGYRINTYFANSDNYEIKNIAKNILEDLKKSLDEYYGGSYTYWK